MGDLNDFSSVLPIFFWGWFSIVFHPIVCAWDDSKQVIEQCALVLGWYQMLE
jgi:hypothetical protein